jgi:hypothetical protein
MVIKKPFKQLPRSVSWRWAAAEIARCLGDEALAEAFRSTKDDLCTDQEWFAMEYLQATRPVPQKVDAEGSCACGNIVLFREPIVPMKELEHLDAANPGHRRSPADLGFSKNSPAGCVSYWFMCVGHYAFGSHRMTRLGRSGRPGSELQLRGALRVLVRKIEAVRSALEFKNVVSPATCVALLLFFEVFANGSRGLNPAFPRIVQRNGVATAKSLRALAHKIDDLTRER